MKCQSCGAPISVMDRSGRYICEYCETQAVTRAIADSVDRLVLTGTSAELACPSCDHDRLMQIGSLDAQPLLGCRDCQGVWMRRSAFSHLVRDRRSSYTGPDRKGDWGFAVDGPRDHHCRLACPNCSAKMESFYYAGPGRVSIDTCAACDWVWLDCGEVTRIVEAPGQRG